MDKGILLLIIILISLLILYFVFRKNFKILNTPCVCFVAGAPKTGKTLLCQNMAKKDYKKIHFKWWFCTLFKKDIEEPLYYTNVKATFGNFKHKKYVKNVDKFKYKDILKYDNEKQKYYYYHKLDRNICIIEKDLFLRKKRFAFKSMIHVDESSLLSDNMDYNDNNRNAEMSLFNKLIGHMTKGGKLYYDSQNMLDNHYSIKRVCANFFFIQKSLNFWLFRVLYVREMISNDMGQNNFIDDLDTTTRKVLIWRWWYFKYDRYEFSYLTNCLPISKCNFIEENGLISFNPLYEELGDKRNLNNKKDGDLK